MTYNFFFVNSGTLLTCILEIHLSPALLKVIIKQFSPYHANILLWILEGFTLSDHKNQMTAQKQNWNAYTMTAWASVNVMVTP